MEDEMRFTTEEAYEASECGEPIMLGAQAVERIIRGQQPDDLRADVEAFYSEHPANVGGEVDAAHLLGWLGY